MEDNEKLSKLKLDMQFMFKEVIDISIKLDTLEKNIKESERLIQCVLSNMARM